MFLSFLLHRTQRETIERETISGHLDRCANPTCLLTPVTLNAENSQTESAVSLLHSSRRFISEYRTRRSKMSGCKRVRFGCPCTRNAFTREMSLKNHFCGVTRRVPIACPFSSVSKIYATLIYNLGGASAD